MRYFLKCWISSYTLLLDWSQNEKVGVKNCNTGVKENSASCHLIKAFKNKFDVILRLITIMNNMLCEQTFEY